MSLEVYGKRWERGRSTHWGPLKVETSCLSLGWGTWPLAAEGLSPGPSPFPAGHALGRESQLDEDAWWKARGLTGPGRAAEQPAGCPRAPAGTREWTTEQVPPWVNRLLPLHPSHQPRQTNATWVSAGGRAELDDIPALALTDARPVNMKAWEGRLPKGRLTQPEPGPQRGAVRHDLPEEAGKMEKALEKGHTEESVWGSAWPAVPPP